MNPKKSSRFVKMFLCTALAICMTICMMPVLPGAPEAKAADPVTVEDAGLTIYVGGTKITDDNKNDVLGDGSVSYVPSQRKLVLNNAEIPMAKLEKTNEVNIDDTADYYYAAISAVVDRDFEHKLKIELAGDNRFEKNVAANDGYAINGLFAYETDVEICGTGSLSETVNLSEDETGKLFGLRVISNNIAKDSNSLSIGKNVDLKLDLKESNKSAQSRAITAGKMMTIDGADVDITMSSKRASAGIECPRGVKIDNSADVKIDIDNNAESKLYANGIKASSYPDSLIDISDSNVEIKAMGTSPYCYGTNGPVKITGASNVRVDANSYAAYYLKPSGDGYPDKTFTISDSAVVKLYGGISCCTNDLGDPEHMDWSGYDYGQGKIAKVNYVSSSVISSAMSSAFVWDESTSLNHYSHVRFPADLDSDMDAFVMDPAKVFKNTANTDNTQKVFNTNDKAWYVIGYDGKGVASSNGNMTLFSAESLNNRDDTKKYNKDNQSNVYDGSIVSHVIDTFTYWTDEWNIVKNKTLVHGNYNGKSTDCIAGSDDLADQKLWLLSTKEAGDLDLSVRKTSNTIYNDDARYWWLRSPGSDEIENSAAYVDKYGNVKHEGINVVSEDKSFGCRPAYQIDLDDILFVCAAGGNESKKYVGDGNKLEKVGKNLSGEWKLTLKEPKKSETDYSKLADFRVEEVGLCDGSETKIQFKVYDWGYDSSGYSPKSSFVSAMITDKNGNITHYGQIKSMNAAPTEDGDTLTLELDGTFSKENGDHLYVFNEYWNGEYRTDVAGELKEIALPAGFGHDWEFVDFTWTGDAGNGYTAAKANYKCKNDSANKSVNAVISENKTAATCEAGGKTTYTATVSAQDSLDGAKKTESKDAKTEAALGHSMKFKDFTWTGNATDGYTAATANYECEREGCSHTESKTATVTEKTTDPTCDAGGKTEYTASVSEQNSPDGKEHSESKDAKITGATGHDWEFVDFTWTGDDENGYTAAKANYKCKNNEAHTKTVDAQVTSETIPNTCETDGKTVYTASVLEQNSPDGEGHSESKDAKITKAKNHDWEFKGLDWTENDEIGYSAYANYECKNDPTHTRTVKAQVTSVITPPACETGGKTTYTAVISADLALDGQVRSDTKDANITSATDHDWEFVGFTWTGDAENGYTAAKANYKCKNNAEHTKTVDAEIGEETISKTCETDGKTVYTASVSGQNSPDGKGHNESKDAKITKATGHSWNEAGIIKASFDKDGKTERECSNCHTKVSDTIRKVSNVTMAAGTLTYDGNEKKPGVTVKDSAGNQLKASDYNVAYANNRNAGRATATVTLKGKNYAGSKVLTFTIGKAANTIAVKGKSVKLKFKKLKKKNQTVKGSQAMTVSNAKGKVTYKLAGVKTAKFKKYFKVIAANGNITVKKKLKKGKYKVTVKVRAAGDANYNASPEKSVTVSIAVK